MISGAADRARGLLVQSLAVWRVSATVEAGEHPVVAVIQGVDTMIQVCIAAESESPIRWWVRTQTKNPVVGGRSRSRPCASTVGLLRSVRDALSVEGRNRLRIAPAASVL